MLYYVDVQAFKHFFKILGGVCVLKQIWTFVITGGPCSGKTTALSTIEQELSSRGYYVLIVPETATELISTGIRPFGNSLELLPFQYVLFEKQLYKEQLYQKVAKALPTEKVVIIHDRGIIDNKSYISEEEFQKLLSDFSMNEVEARDRYDGVFHLVTAANGAEDFYTLANNAARTETPEQARALDNLGISNWTGHSHLRIIDNSTDFERKMARLMSEIYSSLGEPTPLEIERKYLIKKPDIQELAQHVSFTVVDIVQTYLKSVGNVERRIRQRGQNGNFSYYLTEKREISTLKRAESEKKITQKEYIRLLTEMDTSLSNIVKKRICFAYNSQYFEVDLFDFSDGLALMEIELPCENASVDLPDFVDVIMEVTDDPRYRNHTLAKTQTL